MQKEKISTLRNKAKIYLEVNFFLVSQFLEIKVAQPLQVEKIKVEQVLQTLTQILKAQLSQ